MYRSHALDARPHVLAVLALLILVMAGCSTISSERPQTTVTAAPATLTPGDAATTRPVPTAETVGITRTAIPSTSAPAQVALPCVQDAVNAVFAAPPENWGRLAPEGLAIESATLVDVREPKEYTGQTLAGAINIPLRELARRTDLLPGKEAKLLVIAGDAHRAALGTLALQLMGYTRAGSLDGDFSAWQAAGLPLAPGTAGAPAPALAPAAEDELLVALDNYLMTGLPDDLGAIDAEAMQAGLADLSATGGIPPLVVDVRSPELYATRSVTRAINVPLGELVVRFDDIRIGHFKTT